MQSRKERLKTSTLRRRGAMLFYLSLARASGDFADRDQRQLHARLAEPHFVARVNAHALGHALAVHERAVVTVIDEHHFASVAHERAVPARHPRETVGKRKRLTVAGRAT